MDAYDYNTTASGIGIRRTQSGGCSENSHGGAAAVGGAGTKCGRWNPTSEQVKVLTDLFKSGLRTPTTDQIQRISSQLSFYGKIESKNVFYWFQNHKARERQKRRRLPQPLPNQNQQLLLLHRKLSPAAAISEGSQVSEPETRVIETLQLFPLKGFSEADHSEKVRLFRDVCKETCSFSYAEIELDLRLSSL